MVRVWLVIIALSIGVGVVAAKAALFTSLTGRPTGFSWDVAPVNAVLVAIPYLGLALAGATRLLPGLIGLALTLSLWGYGLYSDVIYQWNPDGSGANIGLGLMMMVSPFIISPIALGVDAVQRRASARS